MSDRNLMLTTKVILLTGNPEKIESAEKAFEQTELEIEPVESETPEIQAENSLEVARHAVKEALEEYEKPVIREDHSLYLDAIPGFPGPYISYFDNKITPEKLLELLQGKERTGHFEIATVLGLPREGLKEYSFKVPIKISREVRGDSDSWTSVLMLREESETFAESSKDSRLHIWNQNYRRIAEELEQ
ncbi:MAG: non-canonical purine NTP pyrophosphatase [Candidatus Nanosalina sp.]